MLSSPQQLYSVYKTARASMGMAPKTNLVNRNLVKPEIKEEKPPVKLTPWQLQKLRDALNEYIDYQTEANRIYRPKVKDIINAVCREFNVTVTDIMSGRRNGEIVTPRHVIYYLARRLTVRSFPEIGAIMGGRDHSTILHGDKSIQAKLLIDDDLVERVSRLEAELRKDPADAKS